MLKRLFGCAIFLIAIAQLGTAFAADVPARRIALLIANQAYAPNVGGLRTPAEDLERVKATLIEIGFPPEDIVVLHDVPSREAFLTAVDGFATRAATLPGETDVALLYYAGHGASYGPKNYLVPVGLQDTRSEQFADGSLSVDELLQKIDDHHPLASIIVMIDACRSELKIAESDLVRRYFTGDPPNTRGSGMLVTFSTGAGETAFDSLPDLEGGRASPFALAFAQATRANAPATAIVDIIRTEVRRTTRNEQSPLSVWALNYNPVISLVQANTAAADVGRGPRLATSPKRGAEFQDCVDRCPKLQVLEAGEYTRGAPRQEAGSQERERPRSKVKVKRFAVGVTEVTVDEYTACVAAGRCRPRPEPASVAGKSNRLPAVNLTYSDAQSYVGWLSGMTGMGYRLPTEAEWEYAARAGGDYAFGALPITAPTDATFDWSSSHLGSPRSPAPDGPTEVGSHEPNAFGLYDMLGNVAEWVSDCYVDRYDTAPVDGSAVRSGPCESRVLRGGTWYSKPENTRAAFREPKRVEWSDEGSGFRVVRDLEPVPGPDTPKPARP